jgi:hypothetical protein
MRFFRQVILIASVMLLSWLLMQAVHELGHVAGAKLTGGQVTKVVLHPLAISRTDVQPNPHPLNVVWAGPLVGIFLPLTIWLTAWRITRPVKSVVENFLRFFAGFCLIANGAYIAFGARSRIGDCGEMLRHGSPNWLLWLFGAVTIPAGLWLWHGVEKPQAEKRMVLIYLLALIGVVALELLFGWVT